MDYHDALAKSKLNTQDYKIKFLLECGYKEEVIIRCSPKMQDDMYKLNFKSKFGYMPRE